MNRKEGSRLVSRIACLAILALIAMVPPGHATDVSGMESGLQPVGEDIYDALMDEFRPVTPSVQPYTIEPDLANVVNIADFGDELNAEQIAMIASNGFVVSPSDNKQIYWIYERNDYTDPKIPSFVTVDSMLHTYHFFFDYLLREVETNSLIPALADLTDVMLAASREDLVNAADPDVRDAALRNVAWFALARNLIDDTPPPVSVEDMVNADLQKILAHEERTTSTILSPLLIDFTQFVPRGHYTRSEELERYFRTMMLYGLVGFPIEGPGIGSGYTIQALLMVRNLQNATIHGTSAMELWEKIYEPTTFFVGESDNLSVYDFIGPMTDVYGPSPQPDDFGNERKLGQYAARILALPGPRIEQYVPLTGGDEGGEPILGARVFNFMGQRFIPDSRILQEMVMPKVEERYFPTGLDVFAAMGSDRAVEHLRQYYEMDELAGYVGQMNKMRGEINDLTRDTWQSNLYYGWLWSLQSIIEPVGDGYPMFMRNDAWLDKSLFSSLASWTELRHDTVLYARQSGSECGGGRYEGPPKGYVEPNVEFWTRMQWLTDSTREGLEARGLADAMLTPRFDWLGSLVSLCRTVAIKELAGEEATEDEYIRIQYYGGSLEGLMLSCAGGNMLSEADQDMAVVVDVHTAVGGVLEEGTGRVGIIYVVVPIQDELYLTRGGIMTQYEFTRAASDRLTDEQWRRMLDDGIQPPLAEWTDSFWVDTRRPLTFTEWDSGC